MSDNLPTETVGQVSEEGKGESVSYVMRRLREKANFLLSVKAAWVATTVGSGVTSSLPAYDKVESTAGRLQEQP